MTKEELEEFGDTFPETIVLPRRENSTTTIRLKRDRNARGVRFEADLSDVIGPSKTDRTKDLKVPQRIRR